MADQLKKKWYRQWWGVILLFFLCFALLIFLAIGLSVYRKTKDKSSNGTVLSLEKMQRFEGTEGKNSHSLGTSSPSLTIVEFADFACPASKQSFQTIRELTKKYEKEVKFFYRNYPATAEYSPELAIGAHCAGLQDRFWAMHDKLFLSNIKSKEELSLLAKRMGLNTNEFNDCLNKPESLEQIKADALEAEKFMVKGTPTWYFNGYKVDGSLNQEQMEKIILQFIGK